MRRIGDICEEIDVPTPTPEQKAKIHERIAEQRVSEMVERAAERRADLIASHVPVENVETIVSDAFLDTHAMRVMRRLDPLSRNPSPSDRRPLIVVLSSGVHGCGKTTAAAWWLIQPGPPGGHLQLGRPRFVPAATLLRYSPFRSNEMGALEMARRLAIDDLGTEYLDAKGHLLSVIRTVLDARHRNELPLVVTTNLSERDFVARFVDARLWSRLSQKARFVLVKGDDLRGAS